MNICAYGVNYERLSDEELAMGIQYTTMNDLKVNSASKRSEGEERILEDQVEEEAEQ